MIINNSPIILDSLSKPEVQYVLSSTEKCNLAYFIVTNSIVLIYFLVLLFLKYFFKNIYNKYRDIEVEPLNYCIYTIIVTYDVLFLLYHLTHYIYRLLN